MTDKSLQFAAKTVLMSSQKNLKTFSFTIFTSSPKKNTKNNLFFFKSFQYMPVNDFMTQKENYYCQCCTDTATVSVVIVKCIKFINLVMIRFLNTV